MSTPPVTESVIVINAPHFYAAIITNRTDVIDAAPIVKYMIGWPEKRASAYITSKRWAAVRMTPKNP